MRYRGRVGTTRSPLHVGDLIAQAGDAALRQAVGDPIPAPDLPKGVPVPDAVARYGERFAR